MAPSIELATLSAGNTTVVLPPQGDSNTSGIREITFSIVGTMLAMATLVIAWRQYRQHRHRQSSASPLVAELGEMNNQETQNAQPGIFRVPVELRNVNIDMVPAPDSGESLSDPRGSQVPEDTPPRGFVTPPTVARQPGVGLRRQEAASDGSQASASDG